MNELSPFTQFRALFRVGFRSMTTSVNVGNGAKKKRKPITGMGAIVFLCGICLYISTMYSMMFAEVLAPMGALDVLLLMMLVIGSLFMFLFTVFSAQSVVFGGRDNELLFSLPVSPFLVMLSKISAVYAENFLMGFFFAAPPAVIYLLNGGTGGIGFIVIMLVGIVFLPMVPALLSLLFGWPISVISAKMHNKTLLTNLTSMVLSVGLFIGIFSATQNLNEYLRDPAAIQSAMSFFLPAVLLVKAAVTPDLLSLLYVALISLLPFVLVVLVLSRRYQRTVSMLQNRTVRSDYKLRGVSVNSQLTALIKREAGRYFGVFIYCMNTGFGMILLLLGTGFACVKSADVLETIGMIGIPESLLPYIAGAMLCMFISLSGTTYVSISLEGKTLSIIKSMPVSTWLLFESKLFWNLIVVLPIALLCTVVLGLVYGLGLTGILTAFVLPLCFTLFVATFGLYVNLLLPKLDAPNDTAIVKQSAAAMLGTMVPMLLLIAIAILYFTVLSPMISLTAFYWCCAGISLLAAAVFTLILNTWGQKRFEQLI
ncbi:MAG: hypothetical protein PHO41_04305 [Eubacteriales bacterium]|nr:hypothetical protein [Eubacteriales bacterium]